MLSVFSGIGGFDLGLEASGFSSVGHIETSDQCNRVLAKNRPDWPSLAWNDVHDAAKDLNPKSIGLKKGELDLLVGAPPCQPFSTAGQWSESGMKGTNDARAQTLTSFLTLVQKLHPKVLLLENVPTFWSAKFGAKQLLEDFFENFEKQTGVAYKIHTKVLNSANYGVPQVRRRFILVAHRIDGEWLWPVERFLKKPVTSWEAISQLEVDDPPMASGKWAKLLPSIPEGWNYLWHSDAGDGEPLFGNRTRFWSFLLKLSKTKPSWTIAAQPGPGTGPFHWDNRRLSIVELLALQTFPSDYKLIGSYRDQVRMIGNATPPLLGECLGRSIIKSFFENEPPKRYTYSVKRSRLKVPPSEVQPVPTEYLSLKGKHRRHPGPGLGPAPRKAITK